MSSNSLTVRQFASEVAELVTEALRGKEMTLGVSRTWLAQKAQALEMTPAELETMLQIRVEMHGSLPRAFHLVRQGFSPMEVLGCYCMRQALAKNHGLSASVGQLARLSRQFAEVDTETHEAIEDVSAQVVEACQTVFDRYYWVQYPDQAIKVLCAAAARHDLATLEAATALIDSQDAVSRGLAEPGEVDRHYRDYQMRRKQPMPPFKEDS